MPTTALFQNVKCIWVRCYRTPRSFAPSVDADATADGTAETAGLLARLLNYEGIRSAMLAAAPAIPEGPVLPMHFRKDGVRLSLFTTIATLGTPQDITLQELRIESFFPMDDETRKVFHDWAEPHPRN